MHLAARSTEIEEDTTKASLHYTFAHRRLFLCFQGGDSVLKYLLNRKGIDMRIQDNEGRTALHHAILQGCIKNADALMKKGNKHLLKVSHSI